MHLYLDTDLGTDVDDALALGVILGSPEFEIAGISTVYGDVVLRAQLAHRLIGLAANPPDVAVAPGEGQTRSGKPVWWPGHEGALHADLQAERTAPADSGVADLIGAARHHAGELDVLAIGPLTNIAAALDADPAFETNVRRLVVMGGDFGEERVPEHNFVSDIEAAQRVFDSGLEIVVGGLDLTTQLQTRPEDVAAITAAGPFGQALAAEIAQWWRFHGHEWNNPHDPILAAYLLAPDRFASVRSTVRIDDDGRSWNDPSADGRVQVVTSMDREAVLRLMIERICAADAARV
ncbi:nucleoside hydrolase [Agromyces sp. CFH 90414]|uniref:Nucleoside hydrolase n=1 Tax=Agromyces agglutinans TaxID=2662258 RepID=A0A6I2F7X9_9MICO|nr:nucleoside hydrolase [Agromyces agglutinans]MRG60719.1 nucleoside hydrolase [Agromyces agglutinans]